MSILSLVKSFKKQSMVFLMIFIFSIMPIFSYDAEAVIAQSSFLFPLGTSAYLDNSGYLSEGQGRIWGDFYKEFNFVKSGSNLSNVTSNIVNRGESFTANDNFTTGYWFLMADLNDSPPMDGVIYQNSGNSSTGIYAADMSFDNAGVVYSSYSLSVPVENGNISITSANPDVVSCTSDGCTANNEGTTTVTVAFNNVTQTSPYGNKIMNLIIADSGGTDVPYAIDNTNNNAFYLFNNMGFGMTNVYLYNNAEYSYGTDYKSIAFSFPSITYTITVPAVANTPQTSSCSGATNVTTNGATINWTYTDADNDPQTNYQIQIATDAGLTDVVQSVTAPNNTDVSAVRSHVISGLTTGVTYYAGIKTYNATNGWSNADTYSSCGSFTPSGTPVTPTPLNLSCALNPTSPVAPGTSVTFTAGNTGAVGSITYTWDDPSNIASLLLGSTYTHAYNDIDTYNISLTGSTTDQRTTILCPLLSVQDTSSCNSSHTENQITGPQTAGGTDCQKWNCNSSYVWSATDVMCPLPPPGSGSDPVATFSFDPSVVGRPSDFCGLNLTASNVSSCTLLSPSGNKDLNSHIFNNTINLNKQGNIVTIGRYTLSCTGTTTGALPQTFGTKTCLLNPDVRER